MVVLKTITYILLVATLVVAIIFAVANYSPVTINYFVGEIQIPLSILIFLIFLLGLLFGLALDSLILLRQRSQIQGLKKKIVAVEEELNNLRKMPLKDINS